MAWRTVGGSRVSGHTIAEIYETDWAQYGAAMAAEVGKPPDEWVQWSSAETEIRGGAPVCAEWRSYYLRRAAGLVHEHVLPRMDGEPLDPAVGHNPPLNPDAPAGGDPAYDRMSIRTSYMETRWEQAKTQELLGLTQTLAQALNARYNRHQFAMATGQVYPGGDGLPVGAASIPGFKEISAAETIFDLDGVEMKSADDADNVGWAGTRVAKLLQDAVRLDFARIF